MAWWYVNELVYYKNTTSKLQELENATKDGEIRLFSKKRCRYIEDTKSLSPKEVNEELVKMKDEREKRK